MITDRRMTPLRATAWVGLGSVASLAMSVLAMKAYAVLVGPSGVGLLSLMQSLVSFGLIVGGLGVATASISALSSAVASGDVIRVEGVRRASFFLAVITGAAVAAFLVVLREPIADVALGTPQRADVMVVLAAAVLCTVLGSARLSVLAGRRAIRPLTMVNVATAVGTAAAGVALVWTNGIAGIAPAVLAGALVHLGLAFWFELRARAPLTPSVSTNEIAHIARSLIRQGLPIAASQVAGLGTALLVPVVVLNLLGTSEVGYYRAAAAISIGYLSVFVAALTQDYLPRISAAHSTTELAEMVERQMRLVLGLSLPVILGLLATGPVVLHLLYAQEFSPSFAILKWQLVGDLVRLPGWILAFVLLASGRPVAFFIAELTAGITLLVGTAAGLSAFGLPGAGMGYAASQVIYYAVVWTLVRRNVPTTPGRLQAVALVCAMASVGLLVASPPEPIRSLLFAGGACLLAALAWPRIYRRYRAGEL